MAQFTIQQTFDLAVQHHRAGRLREAEQLYRQVLAQQPDRADAMHFLGMIAHQEGQNDIAADLIRRAIAINPNIPAAQNNLGIALACRGQLDEAIIAFRQAITLRPNFAEAHNNLGNTLTDKGKPDAAIAAYRQAIVLQPQSAQIQNNLGVALRNKGESNEAIAAFRVAVGLRPNYAEAHNNLGLAHRDMGQFDEALTAFREAIAISPNYSDAHSNLGIVLQDFGRLDEAIAAYRQAIALSPSFVQAHNNLGSALKDKGQLDEAIAAYRQALAINPNFVMAHTNLVLAMNYHPGHDAQTIAEELRLWNQRHGEPMRKFIQPHTNDRDPDRRLRIGYVSPDFRDHVLGLNLVPLFEQHDRRQVEITCYSNVKQPDAVTRLLQQHVDRWRNIVGLSDEQVAGQIRQDRIDILVDLALHTNRNRLLVFARKPAPVQVCYLGHCGSTGLSAMDYRLSDPYLDPPETDLSCYSEKTWRLPRSYWCYQPIVAPAPSQSPARTNGFITFGCLNNIAKVSSAALDLWVRILAGVPNSRLIFYGPTGEYQDDITQRFDRAGVTASRLLFVGKQPLMEYMQTYGRIDIALDPFPYTGGITTCDALWMGVPVVTLSGQTAVGRGGRSILSNLGLTELIAFTPDQYVQIAIELAKDRDRMNALRQGMRSRMQASPLMDAKGFARDMEAAYRQMWRAWCETVPPKADPTGDSLYKSSSLMPESTIQQTFDLAMRHHHAGRLREAEQLYRQVLDRQPEHADAMNFLGVIAHQTARSDMAVDLLRRSIALNPSYSGAYSNLGMVLKETGQLDEAIAVFHQAIALSPNYAEAYSNLGLALSDKGQLDQAIAAYRQAITLNPNLAGVHSNLGIALKDQGQLDEAIAAFRRAIALDPSFPDAYGNLGIALKDKGQFDEAMAAFRQAIALNPNIPEFHSNMGIALKDIGQLDEAMAAYRQAMALRPNYAEAHGNLVFALYYHPAFDAKAIAEENHRWNQQYAEPLKKYIQPHSNDCDPDRRLRIGYVSADFRRHASANFLVPLMEHHDPRHVELFCYAEVPRTDDITHRLQKRAAQWRSTVGMPDATVAERIRDDRIDVLVDLKMHTGGNRLLVFARKPAPVQVSWLGYPGGTGLSTIDYRLSDPYLDPPGMDESVYGERTIRLPDTFWCYDPLDAEPAVNVLPAQSQGHATFGCLNNFCKVNKQVLQLWTRVLKAVDRSRLLILCPEGSHRQSYLDFLQREGIHPDRIDLVPQRARMQYLALYHRIDIGLDTFPYNGHTTSLESLWMGVPVVTLVGQTAVGRAGLSQLTNLGLTELIAHTPQQYVQIAAALAGDVPRLAELRRTLRPRMEASPLMDAPKFASGMEAAYRQMWRIWCKTASAKN